MPISRHAPSSPWKAEKITMAARRPQSIQEKTTPPAMRVWGYVVSYLQASKERGMPRQFGKGLCVNNYPCRADRRFEWRRKLPLIFTGSAGIRAGLPYRRALAFLIFYRRVL